MHLPPYEEQNPTERLFFLKLSESDEYTMIETAEGYEFEKKNVDVDPQAVKTLNLLHAPPCQMKVEKDTPVPDSVIALWSGRGFEVEPVGIIKVRIRLSKEYIYPYKVSKKGGK